MDTGSAILWTQVPISFAILVMAWQIWLVKRDLIDILNKLKDKK